MSFNGYRINVHINRFNKTRADLKEFKKHWARRFEGEFNVFIIRDIDITFNNYRFRNSRKEVPNVSSPEVPKRRYKTSGLRKFVNRG